jgi:kumamolisin
MAHRPLAGSERQPMRGARAIGKADPAERLEVSMLLRRANAGDLGERVGGIARAPRRRDHLSAEEFEQQFSASSVDLAAVREFAARHGLAVVQEHAGRRTVVLSGTVDQFNKAFEVDLQQFEHPGGTYRGRVGQVHLPDELHGAVEAVLGLDNRPVAKPHFRSRPAIANVQWHAAAASSTSFSPIDLAKLYDFPPGNGSGQCVGIIELGGGMRSADLQTYFGALGLSHSPQITTVSVDHGRNHPTGDPNGPDGEVMLDVEVVGALVPNARIAVYFAPNTDAGFLDAITTAIHDIKNRPSVISISWGGPESSWTQQSLDGYDSAFQAAAAMGVTICVASGDNGSDDGVGDGADHVDFPASSPHVLACGGTKLAASNGSITSESVWNEGAQGGAGGGGISSHFQLPAYQDGLEVKKTSGASAALTMRGVPDVSGDADPYSGYDVRVDGSNTVIGGTSAVAPLWAGLVARINAATGSRVGLINPALYAVPEALHDITQGNNGSFAARSKWDACTGLGSPDGAKVEKVLRQTATT